MLMPMIFWSFYFLTISYFYFETNSVVHHVFESRHLSSLYIIVSYKAIFLMETSNKNISKTNVINLFFTRNTIIYKFIID